MGTRPVTAIGDDKSRVYGDVNPALTYTAATGTSSSGSGLVNGDSLSGAVTTGAGLTSNVGSYAITQGTLAATSNYALTYTNGNLAVGTRPVTAIGDDKSRVYGDVNPALTYTAATGTSSSGSGLVNGDSLSGAVTTGAGLTSNVGSYAITQGTLAATSNYALTYTNGNLAVGTRPVTAIGDDKSRVYGDVNPALTYTAATGTSSSGSGLVNGDSLSGAVTTGAGLTSNVGSYAITQGTLAATSNYALTYTNGNLAVGTRPVTAIGDDKSRVYGDVNPALTYTAATGTSSSGSGLVNGDSLSGAVTTGAGLTSNVGSYAITQGTLAATSNYALTYTNGNLAVGTRPVTAIGDDKSRVYGDVNPALTYTAATGTSSSGSGLVNGDSLSGAVTTGAGLTSNVGSYAITQGTLAATSNYALTYTNGNLAVGTRPVTAIGDDKSRVYGDVNPALTYTAATGTSSSGSGLVNGDSLSGAVTTGAGLTSNVGSYAITQGTLAATSNYALTYTNGNLAVGTRPVTAIGDDKSRVYGDVNPALTYTAATGTSSSGSGLVNGDSLSGAVTTGAGLTSNVGSYAITQGTLAATSNYALTYTNGNLAVGTRPVTAIGDDKSRVYGDVNPALTYTAATGTSSSGSGLVNGDSLSGAVTTGAGLTSNVGSYAITQGTLAATSNYALTYTNGNLAVGTRPVTAIGDDKSRVYGDVNPALTYTAATGTSSSGSGLVNGDSLSGAVTTGAGLTSNVGSYAITQGTLAATSNYALTYTNGNLAVGTRPVTAIGDDKSRVYGDVNPALTYTAATGTSSSGSGLVNGDSLSGAVTTGAGLTSNVGSYAITQGTLAATSNYALTYTNGNLAVGTRPVTAIGDDKSRVYGDVNPALTYTAATGTSSSGSGLVNGDSLSGAVTTGAGLTSNVGSYAITQGTLAATSNYALTYTNGNLAVGTRPVTAIGDDKSRVYGDVNPALTYTAATGTSSSGSGLVNGDSLSGAVTTGAGLTSNVGSYAITQGTLAATSNYALTYTNGNLAVGTRPVTAIGDDKSRVYGDVNPALTYTAATGTSSSGSGLVNGDSLSGAVTTGAGLTSNVGSYAITQGTLAATSNYALTYTNGNLAVGTRPVTAIGDDKSRVYGDVNPALTYTAATGTSSSGSGLVNGDSLSGAVTTGAGLTSNVGSYAITQGTLAATSNYALTYTNGNLAVGTRPVTAIGDDKSRVYGDVNPALTYTAATGTSSSGSGLVNGDSLSGAVTTGAGLTSNVGSYAITQGTLAATSNYALTYTNGNLAVGTRPVTAIGDDKSRVYGDVNPALTYTAATGTSSSGSGLVNGDSLSGAVTTGAGLTSNVGSYAITQGTLAATSNYALTYTNGNLAVGTRPVTAIGDDKSRVYGDVNPALTYTAATGTSSSGSGLVNGDSLSGAVTTGAGLTSNVGSYAITQGTLAATSNYALTYTNGNLAVGTRPVTAIGDDKSRVYGDVNPALTYTAATGTSSSGSGLVNGDSLSGAVTTGAGLTSNVGSYAITQGTLAATSNYALTYTNGNLAVGTRPVTAIGDDKSRVYGDVNPALTYTAATGTSSSGSGLVNGDSLSGAVTTGAGLTSNVGSYAITQGTLAATSNYALTYTNGNLAVGTRPVTAIGDDKSRVYGDVNPALTYTAATGTSSSGSGLVNGDSLSGAVTTGAGLTSNVGSYAITQGTLAATSNYALTYTNGNLAVGTRPVTAIGDDKSRVYGDVNPALTYTAATGTSSSGSGLVNGDSLSGAVTTGAGLTSNVGSYAITQGTLAATSNYALTYTNGNLAVGTRPVTVTADAGQQKTYGNADPAFTFTTTSLGSGIPVAGALTRVAGETVLGGPYAITQGGVTNPANPNYAISYVGDNFAITTRPITVAPSSVILNAGATIPAAVTIAVVSGSIGAGDQLAASLPVSTTATSTSAAGTYILIPGGVQFLQGSGSNYSITYQNGSLTITTAQLSSDISAYTSAVYTATTTATSAISSGAVAGLSGGTGSSTSSVVTIAPTSSTSSGGQQSSGGQGSQQASTAQSGTAGAGAAAAAAAIASAQLVNSMLELHARKLKAVEKAVKLLEQDPDIADLQFCSGPVSDDCIAVRPAGSDSAGGQQRVAEHAYLPGVERKVALLIGVGDYQGGIPKLTSPVKDVQEIGRIMKDKFGYEVRTVLNADKARIVHELNRLILESNDDDSIAIMYAGHGHLVEKTQRGYWIPSKASADDPKQWLSNQDIARALGNISAKQIFLVSDSCYSGTLTREAKIDRTDIPPDPQAVLGRRSVTALSSGGDEPVARRGQGRALRVRLAFDGSS